MAQKRMFSQDIVDSDDFLDMPVTSQLLYFHLSVRADDDGFISPRKIMRIIGCSQDDLKILIAKRFVLTFESGVLVIKHWLIHNLIRADLYKETLYKKEKATLGLNENGAYTELREGISEIVPIREPEWLKIRRGKVRTVDVPQTALRIGKDRLDKDSIQKNNYGQFSNVLLSTDEYTALCESLTEPIVQTLITELDEYIESKGVKYKSHRATIQGWARRKINQHAQTLKKNQTKIAFT